MKKFSFVAEVWLWPGIGGWHFVNVPNDISKKIREKYGKGMIKIESKIGKTKWGTSLFPYKNPRGEFGYLISIKKNIRHRENINTGDNIKVFFCIK